MKNMNLVCWKCGVSVAELPLPLSRLAECPQCRAYLHACRMCQFHNPRLTGQCDEGRAEEVHDKEHANFCDWFKPRPDAYRPPNKGKTQLAKSKLDALFGGSTENDTQPDAARDKLNNLFGAGDKHKK